MTRARYQFILGVLFFVATPSVGKSQAIEELSVEWRSPDGCSSKDRLIDELKAVLGSSWQGQISQKFEGSAIKVDKKWSVTLEVTTGNERHTRSLKVNTCEAVEKVVALLIALTINPSLALNEEASDLQSSFKALEDADESENEAEPLPQPADDASKKKAVAEPPPTEKQKSVEQKALEPPEKTIEKPPRFAGGLSFVADIGTIDTLAPGLSLDGAFWVKWLRLSLSVWYLPPQNSAIAQSNSGRFRAQLVGASLGAGAHLRARQFHLNPLLGLAVHTIVAETLRIETPRQGSATFLSVWLGVALEWMLREWLGLALTPALCYFFSRPRFEMDGELVHQPKIVAGVLKIGVLVVF